MHGIFSKFIIFIMLMTTVLGSQLFCMDGDGCVELSDQHHQNKSICCDHSGISSNSISHTAHHTCHKVDQNLFVHASFVVSQFFMAVVPICNPIYKISFMKVIPENNFEISYKVEIPPPILQQLSTVVILT